MCNVPQLIRILRKLKTMAEKEALFLNIVDWAVLCALFLSFIIRDIFRTILTAGHKDEWMNGKTPTDHTINKACAMQYKIYTL